MKFKKLIVLIFVLLFDCFLLAKSLPVPLSGENKIKVIHYDPNKVVEVTTSNGYATTIEFGEEKIQIVVTGDSNGWQVTPSDNRLFIKPNDSVSYEKGSSTNITVVTDKRNYYFQVSMASRQNPTFILRFDYSSPPKNISSNSSTFDKVKVRDQKNNKLVQNKNNDKKNFKIKEAPNNQALVKATPEKKKLVKEAPVKEVSKSEKLTKKVIPVKEDKKILNTKYKISKKSNIKVLLMYDDGQSTYLKFDKAERVPLIFSVSDSGEETKIKAKKEGDYYVIPLVGKRFSLRKNNEITCIINDLILNPEAYKKKNVVEKQQKKQVSKKVSRNKKKKK